MNFRVRMRYILEENIDMLEKVSDMQKLMRMSPSHFQKQFYKTFNKAPKVWLDQQRMKKAKFLLSSTNKSITEIAIFHAVSSHDIETFIYLLDSKIVSINMKNMIGESLLMRAIHVESIPMVRYLINHGADLYTSNDDNAMAIDYAQHCKNRDVYNLVHYRILYEKSKGK